MASVTQVGIAFENLVFLKEYRTPVAFRAFVRIYILIIGGASTFLSTMLNPHSTDDLELRRELTLS